MNREKILKYALDCIQECEFEVLYDKKTNTFMLEDLQQANLGNICNEHFNNLQEIIQRMSESYFYDYLLDTKILENRTSIKILEDSKNWLLGYCINNELLQIEI